VRSRDWRSARVARVFEGRRAANKPPLEMTSENPQPQSVEQLIKEFLITLLASVFLTFLSQTVIAPIATIFLVVYIGQYSSQT
jgi:hypothetical protein